MKINFTKKEYRNLIDIIYLGDTVLDGALDGKVPDKYVEIREKIYFFEKEFGYEDLIEYSKEFDGYFETGYYEETSGILDYIDKYDEQLSRGFA